MSEKKILFYYPSNKQSNSLETLAEELSKNGLNIILLTTCDKGVFHETLEKKGIRTFANSITSKTGFVYYFRQIIFLIKFCKKNKIDIVCSHLQHVNFISVFAQFFSKSRFIIFRHHFKFDVFSNDKLLVANRMEKLFDKTINSLAKEIVVPSTGVFNGMVNYEAVNPQKLSILPYIYNFDAYRKPDQNAVDVIREKYKSQLLLLMCSRLIQFKRHYLVFPIIKKLIREGYDIKMIVLDEGPEKESLQKYISDNDLKEYIFMLGFKTDFINYMAASDLMIHPSLTEASNSAVKEIGLLKKAVAVCTKVGDFDDYITNGVNGYLLDINNTSASIENVIGEAYNNKKQLKDMGEKLHETVLSKFNKSSEIVNSYLKYFNCIK
jgi:glycosyltransferase involved in cell wall biosynthesis